jgi:hypothetical protein
MDAPQTAREIATQPPIGYLELLRTNSSFRNLWFGQVVSELGDWFAAVALLSLMLQVTGRVQVVGWFFIITGSLIPVFWIQLYWTRICTAQPVAATKANHKAAEGAEKNILAADFHGCTRMGWHGLLPPPMGTPAAKRRAEVFAQRSQTSALDRSDFSLSPVPRLPASVGQKPRRKSVPSPSPFLHTREVSWNLCNPWQAFEESCQKSIILPICIPDKYGF